MQSQTARCMHEALYTQRRLLWIALLGAQIRCNCVAFVKSVVYRHAPVMTSDTVHCKYIQADFVC